MRKETMTGRERWLAVLNRETPDRVPMDYWATEEATRNLLAHLACDYDEMLRRLHIDAPYGATGKYVGPPPRQGEDIWGVHYKDIEYGTGQYAEAVSSPLARYESVEEIEANYTWPSPDWWDYSHLPEDIKGKEHRPIRGGGSEPLLLYMKLRGDQQAYMDLLANPEIVHYCLDKLFDLAYEDTRRILESIPGQVMITYVAEDLGGQDNLLYSKEQIREFLLPRMKRMMDLAKQGGAFVFTHTDGACREIIPDLIETGSQVLNPIQWRCPGMEREGLKRDFGDKLIFHGAVDNQQTLPFGTIEDVRNEVIDNLAILGEGGGYILGPCHNIQAVTAPEKVIALYETGHAEGWQ
ncbi:MAG: uroporphyrinogen decarboxylase family protein [FCB group bacterium]|jgi:uroporphyrinogen decarboxylase|nr:uroporphyrinogen decarboxylase family protein [FCB group bacterium]